MRDDTLPVRLYLHLSTNNGRPTSRFTQVNFRRVQVGSPVTIEMAGKIVCDCVSRNKIDCYTPEFFATCIRYLLDDGCTPTYQVAGRGHIAFHTHPQRFP